MTGMPLDDAPLAGIRVIDLSRLLPGPAATMHLADFGADVIKVEDTGDGDYLRDFPPQVAGPQGAPINPTFAAVNRGKRSIRLDLKQPAGRDVLLRLLDTADVMLESFRPGVLARLQLDWPTLHARHPRLVLCSLSGYGQSGPLAQAAGHDINYCALTGVLDQTRANSVPALSNLQMGDLLGGTLSALSALLIALLAAQRTGRGRHVDVAMTDGLLAHQFFALAEVDSGTAQPAGQSLLTGGVACYRAYRCGDGQWLAVGALELKFWTAFCRAVGLDHLIEHHWSRGESPGSPAAQATIDAVTRHLAGAARAHWLAALGDVDACVTPVLTPSEALTHPQTTARALRHAAGDATLIGPLAQMTDHAFTARAAPVAGADSIALLRELGLDNAAIEALIAQRAVATS
jgi:alpha-methylacyl-CoA racemase